MDTRLLVCYRLFFGWLCFTVLLGGTLRAEQTQPPPTASEAKILTALEKEAEFRLVDQPLSDFVELLRQQNSIPVQLDTKALTDAGLGSDTPITRHIQGTTLESALDLILSELDLTFAIHDEVLFLTTKTAGESSLSTKIYPVGDLLVADESTKDVSRRGDYKSLIEVITTSAEPSAWDEVGGPGAIQEFRNADALVISQTFRIHRQIEKLLANLRTVKKEHVAGQPKAAQEEVQDDETFYVQVYRLPAAWFRSMAIGGGMGGVATGGAPPAVQQPPAKTPADQGSPKTPKDVQPQFGGGMAAPSPQPSQPAAEELAKAIPAVIEPESWDINGGGGSIRAFDNRLLVRQTRPIHRKIEHLLREME